MELYKPFKSKAKNKKYSVYVKGGKLIHFWRQKVWTIQR